jgi:uncharacterized protein YaiE (UPF0345 family)
MRLFSIGLASLLAMGCSHAALAQKGWISLFDGQTTKGWHSYGQTETGPAWKVVDGTLHLDASDKTDWQSRGGGDIVSEESFGDFHLKVEWKISKNGNSGIIFWVQDDRSKYENVWRSGPEMQVLDDDGHPDAKVYKHRAGDLYDLIPGTVAQRQAHLLFEQTKNPADDLRRRAVGQNDRREQVQNDAGLRHDLQRPYRPARPWR